MFYVVCGGRAPAAGAIHTATQQDPADRVIATLVAAVCCWRYCCVQIKYLSLIPVILAKLTGKEGVRPEFTWKQGQMPEQVRGTD